MRRMSLAIKFLAGRQVSSTKNGEEKNQFGELYTKEMQEITDNDVPVKTKRR